MYSFVHGPKYDAYVVAFEYCTDCCEQVWGTVDEVDKYVSYMKNYTSPNPRNHGGDYTEGSCASKGFGGAGYNPAYNLDGSSAWLSVNYQAFKPTKANSEVEIVLLLV